MAANRNRGTVDLNVYRNQRSRMLEVPNAPVRGTAVPKTRPNPSRNAQPVRRPRVIRKTQKQLQEEAKRSRAVALKVVAIAFFLFLLMGFQIYSHVQVDELDSELNSLNQQISVLKSDNTRRNMELNANISLEKVDQYARNELGMVKISDYQVNYVKLSDADAVEVSGDKIHHKSALANDSAQKREVKQNE